MGPHLPGVGLGGSERLPREGEAYAEAVFKKFLSHRNNKST